ncbi:flavin-containing monooxygenase [Nonomuraea sp. NPDC050663]|uniref:flavin-containing monooxygenase n=1 Tax=Nonomuraea sp. NPDC050663 TaxID=3364370 RepID=UPI0037B16B36
MTDFLIIGAGQAGLAMARELRLTGADVLLLDERSKVGQSWRDRWDSLRLFTSARRSALPGLPFPGPADAYPTKDEVAGYLAAYAERFSLPIRHDTRVLGLSRTAGGGFLATTATGEVAARSVIVATGPFQRPRIPRIEVPPGVVAIHSSAYTGVRDLPGGSVLVAGAGNSGVQIAEELARAGRRVTLAVGRSMAVLPQRVFGRDVFDLLDRLGTMRAPASGLVGRIVRRREPLIGLGPRGLRRLGVEVTGRVTSVTGVDAVVWATGFRQDFSWIDVPGALDDGRPVHDEGVCSVPGLAFIGLPYLRNRGSALLGWVGEDAAALAGRLTGSGGASSRR